VKLLRSDLAGDPDVVRRFIQERSVLMGLDHPGIVKTVDMVAEGDRLGIVMEFVSGGTLAEVLKARGTLPAALAVPVVAGVLDALAYAHGKKVLHRDVKPANVLLGVDGLADPDGVELSDFGIASFADDQGAHATGLVGSPAYMPPELFTSGVVSAESDVYAAGVMLYELLAGRTPFAGPGTAHTVGYRHVTMTPPVLPIDARLWEVITRMLSKQPGDRLSAAEAAKQLRSLPPDALAGDALPPQEAPSWDAAGTVIGPAHGTSGGLQAKRGTIEPQPADANEEIDPNVTVLGGSAAAVKLDFSRPDRPVKTEPKPWLIALIAVLVVALIAGGVTLALTSAQTPEASPSAAPSWTPAHVSGQASPAGLRIDLDARTGQDGAAALTVTLNGPRSTGLSDDVLIVIPPATAGDACPVLSGVDWQPAIQSADGVGAACAYKWPAVLAAGQVLPQTLQVSGDIGDDLEAWLKLIATQTGTALSGVTGSGFALQRVTGLSVQADPVKRTDHSVAVQYRVFAQWRGGQTILFTNNTLTFQATDLLNSLTGNKGLSAVKIETCPETIVHGIVILALQPTPSCTVTITIGDLASPPTSFPINTAGS